MAGRLEDGERGAQSNPNAEDDQAIVQLSEFLQDQSLDDQIDAPRRPMSFLDLPLVIVRKILQDLVQCYTTPRLRTMKLFPLLGLRRVHRFFDAELTWLLGRYFEQWGEVNRQTCLYRAPTHFVVRMLEGCLSGHNRAGSEFVTRMHCAIDTLMEQLQQLGAPKARGEVLSALCHAFVARPWQHELRWRLHDGTASSKYETSRYWSTISAVFVVAMHAGYDNVVEHMLKAYPIVSCDGESNEECCLADAESSDFGLPIDMAITSGQTRQVELLWNHSAKLRWGLSTNRALEVAARRGHCQVIELVLSRLFSNVESQESALQMVGKVMRMAAKHQQWQIVRSLIENHAQSMNLNHIRDFSHSTICIAARYGQDDVVSGLVKWVEPFANGPLLREAVDGGHFSTCELLLRREPKPDLRNNMRELEVFARAVARGGSVEVCELLRPHMLWSDCHEIHFLPIAAERGHLEFAKYAVAKGCDRNPRAELRTSIISDLNRRVRYPDDVRYFALLRAIIAGHQDLVRWMIDDLGMSIACNIELTHPKLRPWHLAAYANTREKLTRVFGLVGDLNTCGCEDESGYYREAAFEALSVYQKSLRLGADYNRNWHKYRYRDA